MFIHVNGPTLNRNLGKYQLPNVWDSILQASPMLQLKPSSLLTSPPLPSLTIHNPQTQSTTSPTTLLTAYPVGEHVLFLVSIKCTGAKHPQTPPQLIQTLPHTAAPSR